MNVMNTRNILISDCSSGIGHCVAHGLKARGWRVFATARQAADVARLHGEGLESLLLGVRDSAAILERTGARLEALFNSAGYGQVGAVEDISREAFREQFETNVFGPQEVGVQIAEFPASYTKNYWRIRRRQASPIQRQGLLLSHLSGWSGHG